MDGFLSAFARHYWLRYILAIVIVVIGAVVFTLLREAYLRAKFRWLMRNRRDCNLESFRAHFSNQEISPRVTEVIYHYFQARTRFPGFVVLPTDSVRWVYGLDDKALGVILDKLSGSLHCGELCDADWFDGLRVKTVADLVNYFNTLRENRK
jgi:hypothetical protein